MLLLGFLFLTSTAKADDLTTLNVGNIQVGQFWTNNNSTVGQIVLTNSTVYGNVFVFDNLTVIGNFNFSQFTQFLSWSVPTPENSGEHVFSSVWNLTNPADNSSHSFGSNYSVVVTVQQTQNQNQNQSNFMYNEISFGGLTDLSVWSNPYVIGICVVGGIIIILAIIGTQAKDYSNYVAPYRRRGGY